MDNLKAHIVEAVLAILLLFFAGMLAFAGGGPLPEWVSWLGLVAGGVAFGLIFRQPRKP